MNILVTGGAGYIGSVAVMKLLEAGHPVTVVDDLSRGHREVISILKPLGDLRFVQDDLGHRAMIGDVMKQRSIELIMHFGALAAVGESVANPLLYYAKNVTSSFHLLQAAEQAGVRKFIFSSSCSVYGIPPRNRIPIRESCPRKPISPYGRSKYMTELMLEDYAAAKRTAGEEFSWAALRYFNVAGCEPSGRVGEDHDPETHIIPICLQAALGLREHVTIFGSDYETDDGTCVRDYIHVEDLVKAHIAVISKLEDGAELKYNLGIGRGYSVRDIIKAAQKVTGKKLKVIEGERRSGDPPYLINQPKAALEELPWKPEYTDIESIIETAWKWMKKHPKGY